MSLFNKIILGILVFTASSAYGQIHCGNLTLSIEGNSNSFFTFDDFSEYNSGLTINNALTIRVDVEHQVVPDPACSWFLNMEVFNNPGAGTPVNEWEELFLYGSGSASNPLLDILEIRVRNSCATSPIDGVYQTFTNNGDIIDIIASLLPVTPAGSCVANVNGPGDYLSNYDEYTFTVDLRVKPLLSTNPGIYELAVRFHLEENP